MVNSYRFAKQIIFVFLTLITFAVFRGVYLYGKPPSGVEKPTQIQIDQSNKCYGCPPKERKNYPEKTLDELIHMLQTTQGSFKTKDYLKDFKPPDVYDFEGDETLFDAIAEYGHAAVERLVECLDSTKPTNVKWYGRPVWLGVLCRIALRRVAYYEPDIEKYEYWYGTLADMPEKPSELQAVKNAWQKVVKKRSYVLH